MTNIKYLVSNTQITAEVLTALAHQLWHRLLNLFRALASLQPPHHFVKLWSQILSGLSLPLRVAFLRFGWILPLAVLGLVAGRRRLRELTPWLVLVGIGWLQTLIFFATGRYRIAVIAGFLALAAGGVATVVSRLRERHYLAPVAVVSVAGQ